MRFGERIRYIRKQSNLTLQEVSKRSGLHKSNISEIENEKRFKPTLNTLERLAQALECRIGDFFDRTPDPEEEITRGLKELLADYDARILYNITEEEIDWLKSIRFNTTYYPARETYLDLLKTYRKLTHPEQT